MEAAREKHQHQRRKGSETQSCCLPDALLCRGYEAVLGKLKSTWCLSSIPPQLRPHEMVASHRHQQRGAATAAAFRAISMVYTGLSLPSATGCLFTLPPLLLAARAANVMLLL